MRSIMFEDTFVKSILDNCWVIVEPPPELLPVSAPVMARAKDFASIPECVLNRSSSVEIRAFTRFGES